jgi:tRNA pseudouridine55 synthase
LLLDKPRGISSNVALQRAKRLFSAAKAGHTGTLDVLASGLLPICFGQATKVCQFLLDADKRYLTEFTLGCETTTGDAEGEALTGSDTTPPSRIDLEHALRAFRGAIEQVPPMYSALKHQGRPLYALAARGIEIVRAPRKVEIYQLDLLDYLPPRATFDVHCSKGTYIRSLAVDLGRRLGCGAHVSGLRRTATGGFTLDTAFTFETLAARAECGNSALDDLLLRPDAALDNLPDLELDADTAARVSCGQSCVVPEPARPQAGLVRLYHGGRFIGIGEIAAHGRLAPRRIFDADVARVERAIRTPSA